MAQRLMVARAILHGPAILFLDEPTAGLDPQSRLALWEILGELHADGETILLTTHYMEEADQLCDRVGDHGPRPDPRPRHAGGPEADGRRRHDRHGDRDGDLDGLERLVRRPDRRGRRAADRETARVVLNVRGSDGILPRWSSTPPSGGGFNVTDLSIAEPTLETVFITLTGKDLRD